MADTPVLMADGTAKPVQDVQVGDEVAAYDPDTDTTQPRTVTNTFVHEQVEILVVRLEDGGAVETTAGHPFWTRDRGWTPAGHLKPGDQLHTPDNTWTTVTSVESTGQARTVYNLEVEDLHTYHVRAGTTWTTVHNTCNVDKVIKETQHGKGNITSQYKLTEDEALEAGEKWLGDGYSEIGRPGQGVFGSADGTRQFRMDDGSLTGAHSPGVPHVHLEALLPGSNRPYVNNHIPLIK